MDREISNKERQRQRLRSIAKVAVPVAAGIATLWFITGFTDASVKRSELTFATVKRGTIESTIASTGKVVPAFEEIITSPINSRIIEVYHQPGDHVYADTPLLRLDLSETETQQSKLNDQLTISQLDLASRRLNNETRINDLEMQLKVKEMDVNRLESEVMNEQRLDSLGSGTGERVRQARLNYNTGCLQLQQLRHQIENERQVLAAELSTKELELNIMARERESAAQRLREASVRSPRAATLTFINSSIGAKVSQDEHIATIADLEHFKVTAEVADTYADRFTAGSNVTVRIGQTDLEGTVASINPLSANGSISFAVQLLDSNNSKLRPGVRADVYIKTNVIDDAVITDIGNFYTGPGVYSLFVIGDDGCLHRRNVELGAGNWRQAEVIRGLEPGDEIVISSMEKYKSNDKLKLK